MQPKTFLVGVTQPDMEGLIDYLRHTGQEEFMQSLHEWQREHPRDPLCLVSFYAKLCYKSLVLGKNANVTRIRDMEDNITGCIKQGHGSVFEHVWLNFVTTGCSRVFTHELVRHRVGTAFSQTSGRYVAIDKIDLVLPPELENNEAVHMCPMCQGQESDDECMVCEDKKLISIREFIAYMQNHASVSLRRLREMLIKPDMDFAQKKRLTSAIRRLAPNGQDNEIGWSCNVRSLRHMIEMRTSLAAEWEIRQVFGQVYDTVKERWPLMLEGVEVGQVVDGVAEMKGLKL